eukprot:TRINITY_DN27_c0_g1_i1.p1 TRINITY_DN27_c0_g1~~TRINITY_DN27_c0_g1_i1.p1  ORF type:complete len:127 (+),score=23.40 TRINITY_DN27_c0_g1_i1:43-423(+)
MRLVKFASAALRPSATAVRPRWQMRTALSRTDVLPRVIRVVEAHEKVDVPVTETSHFSNDLGLDSLDVVEIHAVIEMLFNVEVTDELAEKFVSVNTIVDHLVTEEKAVLPPLMYSPSEWLKLKTAV